MMSFIGQVCLHIQEICYSEISSTVQQKDSIWTGHRQQKNNIQIGNVQNGKKTQYQYRQLCLRSDMCTFEMKIISMVW